MIKINEKEISQFRNKLKVKIARSNRNMADHPLKCLKREYIKSTSEGHKAIILEQSAYFAERRFLRATAIRIKKTILRLNNNSKILWDEIIKLYIERKRYIKALEVCKEASSAFPNDIWIAKSQININFFLKRHDEIVEICKKFLDDHPKNVYFREVLAELYDRIGSFDKSYFFYNQIIELDPSNQVAQKWIEIYSNIKEKRTIVDKCKEDLKDFFNDTKTIKSQRNEVYTYFLLSEKTDLMKIGFTTKYPYQRLAEIQGNSPDKLSIIAYVRGNLEKELHDQFKEYRIHGEWFKPTPKILYMIIKLLMDELQRN